MLLELLLLLVLLLILLLLLVLGPSFGQSELSSLRPCSLGFARGLNAPFSPRTADRGPQHQEESHSLQLGSLPRPAGTPRGCGRPYAACRSTRSALSSKDLSGGLESS